jgi:hypothetical protein
VVEVAAALQQEEQLSGDHVRDITRAAGHHHGSDR